MKPSVLILSALDFKEKSIVVLRKTPESYVAAGWPVTVVVARDPYHADYFYEKPFDPPGAKIVRFQKPLSWLRSKLGLGRLNSLVQKLSTALTIFWLAGLGIREFLKAPPDIVYGYEFTGVLSMNFLRLLNFFTGHQVKWVTRFQGVIWSDIALSGTTNLAALCLKNWPSYLAYKSSSDLCIMTDDGTRGVEFFRLLKSPQLKNIAFLPNGVDLPKFSGPSSREAHQRYGAKYLLMTSCRLVDWKRVERGLEAFAQVCLQSDDFRYLVVGDGPLRHYLEERAKELQISDKVNFLGAIPNSEVLRLLHAVDAVMLTYDFSNVGNPLLEAMRSGKLIFTLNTGDTKQWIQHRHNGFIFELTAQLAQEMAAEILRFVPDPTLSEPILKQLQNTCQEKIVTWDERMEAEHRLVQSLLSPH